MVDSASTFTEAGRTRFTPIVLHREAWLVRVCLSANDLFATWPRICHRTGF